MKKQIKRMISISLIVCICTVIGSSFLPVPVPDRKEKSSISTVLATGADAVVTEVTSAWLLELLASLGISAETYGLLSSKSKVEWQIEQLEKYRPEGYVSSFASSSSGSGCSVINDFANQVSYKITHSDAAVSKTLSDGFISRLEKALTNPKAAEEFQKLIEAAQNGLEITGGMVKNLWLMLTKGAIDDYNAKVEDGSIQAGYEAIWQPEYELFKYSNWSDEMIEYHNSRTSSGQLCPILYGINSGGKLFVLMFNNVSVIDFSKEKLVIKSTDKTDFTTMFKLFIHNGKNWILGGSSNPVYGVQSSSSYKQVTFDFTNLLFRYDIFNPYIPAFPYGLTDEFTVETIDPADVITEMPEKIVNDDVISIPDGTTVEDIAVPLPGDVSDDDVANPANPALPGVGTPTLVGGIVGDLVPVDDIDFPWENVANPDLPVDPSVPADPAVPANPDYELDPKDYEIKPIIIEKFPFCIPWDVVKCVSLLGQTPEVPKFEYRFYIKSLKIDETFVIDLKDFEPVANVSRWFFRILFIFGLAVATRNLIRG